MKYKIAAISEVGNVRKVNEDSFLVCRREIGREDIVMLVVADGMGGLSNGDFASRYVVENLQDWWQKEILTLTQEPSIQYLSDVVGFKIEAIQNGLLEICKERQAKMGTTLSLLLLYKDRFFIKQVGDSRVYCFFKKNCYQLSKDQTWCQKEYDEGRLTFEEMLTHEKRHVLINAIGNERNFFIVTEFGSVQKGQRYLLCSDGYYAYMNDKELYPRIFHNDIQKQLEKTADRIRQGEAKDNFTAVLLEVR